MANTFAEKLVCNFYVANTNCQLRVFVRVHDSSHICRMYIYLHDCQALCDYNIALKTNFLQSHKIFVVSSTQVIIFIMENCQTKIAHVNGALL